MLIGSVFFNNLIRQNSLHWTASDLAYVVHGRQRFSHMIQMK